MGFENSPFATKGRGEVPRECTIEGAGVAWLTVGVVGLHALGLKHGNGEVQGIATGVEDGLLAASKTGDCVGAAIIPLLQGGTARLRDGDGHGRCGQGESEDIEELHGEDLSVRCEPGVGMLGVWETQNSNSKGESHDFILDVSDSSSNVTCDSQHHFTPDSDGNEHWEAPG